MYCDMPLPQSIEEESQTNKSLQCTSVDTITGIWCRCYGDKEERGYSGNWQRHQGDRGIWIRNQDREGHARLRDQQKSEE